MFLAIFSRQSWNLGIFASNMLWKWDHNNQKEFWPIKQTSCGDRMGLPARLISASLSMFLCTFSWTPRILGLWMVEWRKNKNMIFILFRLLHNQNSWLYVDEYFYLEFLTQKSVSPVSQCEVEFLLPVITALLEQLSKRNWLAEFLAISSPCQGEEHS